jgi:hypothetical protein
VAGRLRKRRSQTIKRILHRNRCEDSNFTGQRDRCAETEQDQHGDDGAFRGRASRRGGSTGCQNDPSARIDHRFPPLSLPRSGARLTAPSIEA